MSDDLAKAIETARNEERAIARQNLLKYGSHTLACQRNHHQMNARPDVCDCGYEAARDGIVASEVLNDRRRFEFLIRTGFYGLIDHDEYLEPTPEAIRKAIDDKMAETDKLTDPTKAGRTNHQTPRL